MTMSVASLHDGLLLATTTPTDGAGGLTLLEQLQNGGITGYLILLLSGVAVALIVIHFISIRPDRLSPPHVAAEISDLLGRRDINSALEVCNRAENDCFLTRVLRQGLVRFQRSALGPFEFKTALEEAGSEQVARLYRSTDALGLIGAIAPMMGLLGTVIGMVGAFDTISNADARPELLAGDISQALITTLMGLCLAIPSMAAFTFLRNRIDAYTSDIAHQIETMTHTLEPGANSNAGTAPRRGPAPQPAAAATPQGVPGNPTRPAAPPRPPRPPAGGVQPGVQEVGP